MVKIEGEVKIGRVYYLFFRKLIVTNLTLSAEDGSRVAAIEKLSLKFHPRPLLSGELHIDNLKLERGEFNIVQLNDSTTNLDLLFTSKESSESEGESNFTIDASNITVKDFIFTLKDTLSDSFKREEKGVINFSNLYLHSINLAVEQLSFQGDSLRAKGLDLNFKEQSGYRVDELKANLLLTNGAVKMEQFHLQDIYSKLNSTQFNLLWDSPKPFKNFLERVNFQTSFYNSHIDFNSLSFFASDLKDNKLYINFEGEISGPIANLSAKNLQLSSKSGISTLKLNSKISGLPLGDETMLFVDIERSSTTFSDIAAIVASLDNSYPDKNIRAITPLTRYSFSGRLAGLLTDFVLNGTLTSNMGTIYTDALFKSHRDSGFEISGDIKTNRLDLGKLLSNDLFGKLSLSTKMSALFREEKRGGDLFSIDSLRIEELELNNYPYSNIFAAGRYEKSSFDGKLICRDPNLNLMFQGIVDLTAPRKGRESHYDFFADIIYANLAALNIDNRDTISSLSLKTAANFTQKQRGVIEGSIEAKEFQYINSEGTHPIGELSILSSSQKGSYRIDLKSNFADGRFRGNSPLPQFINSFKEIASGVVSALIEPPQIENGNKSSECTIDIEFHQTHSLLQFLLPGMIIADNTKISGEIKRGDTLSISLKSNELGYKKSTASNLNIEVAGSHRGIGSRISSNLVEVAGLSLESANVRIMAIDNNITLKSEYSNIAQSGVANGLNFHSELSFSRSEEDSLLLSKVKIYPSEVDINGTKWKISNSTLSNYKDVTQIDNFMLHYQDQHLAIDGRISKSSSDTLSLLLNKMDIEPISNLLAANELSFKGVMSGTTKITNLLQSPVVNASLTIEEMQLNSNPFGSMVLVSEWNDSTKQVNIIAENNLNDSTPLKAIGYYRPKEKELDIDFELRGIGSPFLEPLFVDIFSSLGGTISGDLNLHAKGDKFTLTGSNARAENLSLMVDFTKVKYTLNGPIDFTNRSIEFKGVELKDRFGNIGKVNGALYHQHFDKMEFKSSIDFVNLELLNCTEEDHSDFYGDAFGTGKLEITGPLDKLLLDLAVTTNKNSAIHIPLTATTEVSSNSLLTFREPAAERMERTRGGRETLYRGESELEIKLRANMTPDAAMLIEIDKSVGDIITGYGSGLITLEINPTKDLFSIQGDYRIQSGSYKFVLQGFIERDFTIAEGGLISFNGDLNKTNLNATAHYRTKASINTLISDTSSVSSRRSVDCQINLSGQLMNPNLGFNIDIPEIDPITKARVSAALNTEDKMVRQVMSLLVSGSFIPDVQSSIVNNSTLLYSNATDLLSNQINKIFNQLDIPLDLSFNYQPGQNGRDLFDAAISAQLFNNRVIVNGNIGSGRYSGRQGEVVGDLDVEIKIDERGRFRGKLFSHSADQYSTYLDFSQRNGVGLVYQEEFNSFKELFRNLFGKKRRERAKIRE